MVRTLIEELTKYEKTMADALMQAAETKQKLLEEYNMMEMNNENPSGVEIKIPFAAYETQLERFQEEKRELQDRYDREKEAMRKHYRNLVKWISISFVAFILCVFGTVIWFFNNYDFATYTQDTEYGNTNFIGNDGDISNGEANYFPGATETPEQQGNVD